MIIVLLTTLVTLINASRADVNARPLREDPALNAGAKARAQHLCSTGQFSHTGYQSAFNGLAYRTKGENLAQGPRDAASVHRMLMNSPGHRANILKREFSAIGVGRACNITVELFGGK